MHLPRVAVMSAAQHCNLCLGFDALKEANDDFMNGKKVLICMTERLDSSLYDACTAVAGFSG